MSCPNWQVLFHEAWVMTHDSWVVSRESRVMSQICCKELAGIVLWGMSHDSWVMSWVMSMTWVILSYSWLMTHVILMTHDSYEWWVLSYEYDMSHVIHVNVVKIRRIEWVLSRMKKWYVTHKSVIYVWAGVSVWLWIWLGLYGVATSSRLLKMMGLFCRIKSLL